MRKLNIETESYDKKILAMQEKLKKLRQQRDAYVEEETVRRRKLGYLDELVRENGLKYDEDDVRLFVDTLRVWDALPEIKSLYNELVTNLNGGHSEVVLDVLNRFVTLIKNNLNVFEERAADADKKIVESQTDKTNTDSDKSKVDVIKDDNAVKNNQSATTVNDNMRRWGIT